MKILVTGGLGYIGSHTIVDLVDKGFDVVCIDNLSRGDIRALAGIEKITQKKLTTYYIDVCDAKALHSVFAQEKNIEGIIHFAAYKSVNESVQKPLLYFQNNVLGLINMLDACVHFNVSNFIFSSSCSVYGDLTQMPVTEETPLGKITSPYARTKRIGEEMIADVSLNFTTKFISLRYFNPVGAHPTALLGEMQKGKPENLVPAITQFASGIIPDFYIHGNDYPTRDGTCIRDYVHVCDIAHAHALALQHLIANKNEPAHRIINLGSGKGVSVLEAVRAFENIAGLKINYKIGPRREGDVIQIYADYTLAKQILGWQPKYTIEDMMRTAWQWQQKLTAISKSNQN